MTILFYFIMDFIFYIMDFIFYIMDFIFYIMDFIFYILSYHANFILDPILYCIMNPILYPILYHGSYFISYHISWILFYILSYPIMDFAKTSLWFPAKKILLYIIFSSHIIIKYLYTVGLLKRLWIMQEATRLLP